MTILAFDTLSYATKLKNAGMSAELADVQTQETAKILKEWSLNHVATKHDLKELQMTLGFEMKNLELRMYKFVAATAAFTVGLLGGLQTLFHFIE